MAYVTVNGTEEVGIFEGQDKRGNKTFGWTLRRSECFINIKPLVTAGDIKSYKVTFVEVKGLSPSTIEKGEVDDTF